MTSHRNISDDSTLTDRTNIHLEVSQRRSMNNAASSPGSSSTSSRNQLAPKPLRRCRSASPAPPKAPLLSTEQQNLIRKSWQRVSKTAIGKSIYQRMTAKCPDSKTLFLVDLSSVSRHERYFVDLLQSAIDNLNDMERALKPWLEMIGQGHAGFAIKSRHWDAFGEAVVSAISDWVGPGKLHRETIRAWMLLSSFISDRLGAAASAHRSSHLDGGSGNGQAICTPRIQLLTLVTTGPTGQN